MQGTLSQYGSGTSVLGSGKLISDRLYNYIIKDFGFGVDSTWDGTCKITGVSKVLISTDIHNWTIEAVPYIPTADSPASSNTDSSNSSHEHKEDNHVHSPQLVKVSIPTANSEGLEEYRCSCGYVYPVGNIFNDHMTEFVKNAPEGGIAEYTTTAGHCVSDTILTEWSKRSDVAIQNTFAYKDVNYQFTIPAGTSFQSLLEDDEQFYGFFTLCQKLGVPVKAL